MLFSPLIYTSANVSLNFHGAMKASFRQTDRQGDLTCQRCVGEMLRLAALPFAVDDVEVDFN